MVKPRAYTKTVLRAIRSSFSRFLAIFSIVALGTGFLAGLMATTPDMRHSADVYYTDTRFMDLRIIGNLGLCEEDLQAIRSIEGIKRATGAHSTDVQVVTESGHTLVARMHGVRDDFWGKDDPAFLNQMTLASGRWPAQPNEVVIEAEYRTDGDLALGSPLTLLEDSDALSRSTFTVVGTVTSGYYISAVQRGSSSVGSGRLGCIVYLCDSVFTLDYYTDIYAVVSGASEQDTFSDAYSDTVTAVQRRIKALSDTQKNVRRDALTADAKRQLALAQAELNQKSAEGRKKLDDAHAELEEGQQTLDLAAAKLRSGENDYAGGLHDLQTAKETFETEYKENKSALNDGKLQLEEGWAAYHDGLAALKTSLLTLNTREADYAAGKQQLENGKPALDAGKANLTQTRAQLDNGWREYHDGYARLNEAAQQLDDAQQQIDDGYAELQTAIDQIKAEKEARDAIIASENLSSEALRAALVPLLSEDSLLSERVKTRIREYILKLDAQLKNYPEETDALIAEGRAVYEKYSAAAAQAQVDHLTEEATAMLKDAETKLADSRAEYARRAALLEDALKTLEDGELAYDSAYIEWNEGFQQYEAALSELNDARTALDDGWAQYYAGQARLEATEEALKVKKAELSEGEIALTQGRETALQSFTDAEQDLRDARATLDSRWTEFDKNKAVLNDGWAEYQKSLQTYEDEIERAQDQLTLARDKIDDIAAPAWYVLTRDSNPGYVSYGSDTLKVESIAKVFPIFFFAVAALVASTTMTRMVEEDRGHIGTLKALGYGSGKIAAKYLIYALTAGLVGSAVGLLIGLRLFPAVIYNAYGLMYHLPPLRASNHAFYALLSTGLILGAILLATYGALHGTLKARAADLMRPKAPPAGKRILLERVRFLWKRMKFTHKVTARNLFRYKKRFLMTVIGIAGCTALLLAGFGLRDSIGDIVGLQFGELLDYNLTVSVRHEGDEESDRRLRAVFTDQNTVTAYTAVHMESCTGHKNKKETDLYVVVPQDASQLSGFIVFRRRLGHQPVSFTESAALITEKAADKLNVKIGDSITLRRTDDSEMQVPIGGIVENYVYGYLYLPPALYESGFGEACEYTTLLCRANDPDESTRDAISTALLSSPNTLSVQFSTTVITTFDDMLKSIDYIVIVIIVSAGALAFVVLYNLTNINIRERQKELATIKVLGFYASEVSAYVYRETILLSLIGIAAGLIGGVFLHSFVVRTAEVDAMMFGRIVRPLSYVYSAAMTSAFTLLVSLVMNVKLRKIDMVESLKAPE